MRTQYKSNDKKLENRRKIKKKKEHNQLEVEEECKKTVKKTTRMRGTDKVRYRILKQKHRSTKLKREE